MHLRFQKGELSLLWAAVLVGVVALAAMVALMSARYERNYFAEAWKRMTKSEAGQAIRQTQQSTENAVRLDAAAVRKCTVDGKVVYSNVECSKDNPSSRTVQLNDSRGFEAPKAPPALETAAKPDMREKMIEKAIQR
jgi:hypothetical protein